MCSITENLNLNVEIQFTYTGMDLEVKFIIKFYYRDTNNS